MAFRKREVVGVVFDPAGNPVKSGAVTFRLTLPVGYTPSHLVIDRTVTTQTDENGHFSKFLWCDEDSEVEIDYTVTFPVTDFGPSDQGHTANFSLRYGSSSINISELINSEDAYNWWGEYEAEAIDADDHEILSTWPDLTPNGHDLTMTSFVGNTLETNEINGLPVVRFEGQSDHAYRAFSHPITIYDAFFVMKYRNPTFIALNRMAFGDLVSETLVGQSGGTVWSPLTNMEYRRNGILQDPTAAPAPMNVFDLIHLRFDAPLNPSSPGRSFAGLINIASSASQGYPCPVDIGYMAFKTDSLLDDNLVLAKTAQLMGKYGLQ